MTAGRAVRRGGKGAAASPEGVLPAMNLLPTRVRVGGCPATSPPAIEERGSGERRGGGGAAAFGFWWWWHGSGDDNGAGRKKEEATSTEEEEATMTLGCKSKGQEI